MVFSCNKRDLNAAYGKRSGGAFLAAGVKGVGGPGANPCISVKGYAKNSADFRWSAFRFIEATLSFLSHVLGIKKPDIYFYPHDAADGKVFTRDT